jgi:hypothetical protein
MCQALPRRPNPLLSRSVLCLGRLSSVGRERKATHSIWWSRIPYRDPELCGGSISRRIRGGCQNNKTTVAPDGKVLPEEIFRTTGTGGFWLSTVPTSNVTTAPWSLVASATMSSGTVKLGEVWSNHCKCVRRVILKCDLTRKEIGYSVARKRPGAGNSRRNPNALSCRMIDRIVDNL